MKKYKKKTKEELQQEVKELSNEFKEGLENLFQSNEYMEFLNFMARRYDYSFRNSLLIYLQKPNATYVAGYSKFLKEYDMQVQKDEKGIRIFAPIIKKYKVAEKATSKDKEPQEDQEEEREYISFRIVRVFDISQTKPLTVKNEKGEDIISPKAQKFLDSLSFLTTAEIKAPDEIDIERLITAVTAAVPIPIRYRPLQEGLGGYFSFKDKDDLHIVLNSIYGSGNTFETLVHEWTHYELHNPYGENGEEAKKTKKKDREIQAESSAYIVLKHFGIDASCEALKYVASWSKTKTTDDLKESMEIIQKIAAKLITAIEDSLQEEPPSPILKDETFIMSA